MRLWSEIITDWCLCALICLLYFYIFIYILSSIGIIDESGGAFSIWHFEFDEHFLSYFFPVARIFIQLQMCPTEHSNSKRVFIDTLCLRIQSVIRVYRRWRRIRKARMNQKKKQYNKFVSFAEDSNRMPSNHNCSNAGSAFCVYK